MSPAGSLQIGDCVLTGRKRIELILGMTTECKLDGAIVRSGVPDGVPGDAGLTIVSDASGKPQRTLVFEPGASLKKSIAEALPLFACDAEAGRIFYANPMLGYVLATDANGKELWRTDLPGFRSVARELEAREDYTPQIGMQRLDTYGSIATKVVASGAYIVVEYRTADRYYQTVFHRSGILIGTIGPWNAVVVGSEKAGWRVAATLDDQEMAYFFPDRELTLALVDEGVDALAEHLVAAVTPKVAAGSYVWTNCPSVVVDIGELLGDRWRSELAKIALKVRDDMGHDWLASVAARLGKPGSIDVRRALLAAGVDVEMMRAAVSQVPELAPKP